MNYSHNTSQVSLFDFKKAGFTIPPKHHLVELANTIDWELWITEINNLFANEGRNSKSIRMMIGLEMAKTYLRVSDEQIVSMLQTDVTVMYFCGYSSPYGIDVPNSSSMTKFRNRLTPEVMKKINEQSVKTIVRKLPSRKRGQVAGDTTCLPANITYPTDTGLLSKTIQMLNLALNEVRATGTKIVVRGTRKIKKTMDNFNQKRKKSKKEIRKTKLVLINHVKRQLRALRKTSEEVSKKSKQIIETSKEIAKQQIIMYREKTNKIPNRIVSFHETSIRPVYRGKQRASTEFGKKVSLQVIGQKIILPRRSEYKNFSDTEIPIEDVKQFKKVFKRNPNEYEYDRGGHSPKNHDYLKEEGIHDGIEYRGRIPKKAKLPPPTKRKRMRNQRSPVEAKIGTLKTRYRLSRIQYKADNTEVRWNMGIFLHNMRWYVNN